MHRNHLLNLGCFQQSGGSGAGLKATVPPWEPVPPRPRPPAGLGACTSANTMVGYTGETHDYGS